MTGTLFLAVRMAVYVLAVPVAVYLGGSFDPATGIMTIDVDVALDALLGLVTASATFLSGGVAKAAGWPT